MSKLDFTTSAFFLHRLRQVGTLEGHKLRDWVASFLFEMGVPYSNDNIARHFASTAHRGADREERYTPFFLRARPLVIVGLAPPSTL